MIQENELRVNNWVRMISKNVSYQITRGYDIEGSEDFKAIELTEEILLKCGFVGNKVAYKLENDKFILELYYYDCWNLTYIEKDKFGNGSVELQGYWNLHQLQNLYFALIGEELEINL